MTPDPTPKTEQQPAPIDDERNDMLAALDSQWRVGEPSIAGGLLAPIRRFLIQQFVRPFVVPLIERQNAYNAAATRALYALAENSDRRRSADHERFAANDRRFEGQDRRLDANDQRVGEDEAQIRELRSAINQASERLDAATRDIGALEQHVLDLDDTDTTLAELLLLEDSGGQSKVEPGR
jgi:hypothetical protein